MRRTYMHKRSKLITIFFFLLVLSISVWAQNPIPNPGFETWTEGQPDGWYSNNIMGVATFVTQSDMSHSGSNAVKGSVASVVNVLLPPSLWSDLDNVTISQNYTTLSGYYQFSTSGSDSFFVSVILYDDQFVGVAYGGKGFGPTTGGYQKFMVNLEYSPLNNEPAAHGFIQFVIISESETPDMSSTFLIDDVEFSGVTAVELPMGTYIPDKFNLDQNYPNPFNPITNIKFQLPEAEFVTITVYNTLGQEVESLLNKEMPAGIHHVQFDAKNLAGGVYFYKMQAGNFVQIKKMILVK